MSDIDIEVEDEAWNAVSGVETVVEQAAMAALLQIRPPKEADRPVGLTILLTDDEAVADLNERFRQKAGPTNVLSFPAPANPENHMGDIALAHGVCAREAAEQGKALADHLRHLTVHGVLHLAGYDHQTDDEAEAMEALERRVLAGLGVADPYAADPDAEQS